jgi:hypothetical protein
MISNPGVDRYCQGVPVVEEASTKTGSRTVTWLDDPERETVADAAHATARRARRGPGAVGRCMAGRGT